MASPDMLTPPASAMYVGRGWRRAKGQGKQRGDPQQYLNIPYKDVGNVSAGREEAQWIPTFAPQHCPQTQLIPITPKVIRSIHSQEGVFPAPLYRHFAEYCSSHF